jgi:hypothetical protein
MTGKADFSDEEWKTVLEGPPSAGLLVIASDRGGSIRETISIATAYTEAQKHPGESELLDELVSAKPEIDHTRFHSVDEVRQHCLEQLRQAVALLEQKASPEEVEGYKRFVVDLADRVANARREGFLGLSGERVSDAEQTAVDEIAATLGIARPESGG